MFPKIRNQLLYQRIEEKDTQLALLNDDLTVLEQDNLELQAEVERLKTRAVSYPCLLYTSPSPRDRG